jgi:hypothetical protein
LTKEFWLSGSLSHEFFLFRWNLGYHEALFTNCSFSRWNLGYHEALFTNFSLSRWTSGYQGAFHTNFFSFTMEFWLSRSLSHELFLFHDGILAIKEPFTRTFSLSRWNSGYQGAFHTNFFSFTMEFWLPRSLSHELFSFHDGIHKISDLGEDSFHIYHKEYLHRIRFVKNLVSWFRAPFARKRVRSSLF